MYFFEKEKKEEFLETLQFQSSASNTIVNKPLREGETNNQRHHIVNWENIHKTTNVHKDLFFWKGEKMRRKFKQYPLFRSKDY